MLRQAAVSDVRNGLVSRARGHVAVVMRFYPRGLVKEKIDEYISQLAPELGLFEEFKRAERALGDHDRAFSSIDYESRFDLSEEGYAELQRLSELSRTKDVFLVCQCKVGQRCHRELLLMIAKAKYHADTAVITQRYSIFEKRL